MCRVVKVRRLFRRGLCFKKERGLVIVYIRGISYKRKEKVVGVNNLEKRCF